MAALSNFDIISEELIYTEAMLQGSTLHKYKIRQQQEYL